MTEQKSTTNEWEKDIEAQLTDLNRVMAMQFSSLDIQQQETSVLLQNTTKELHNKLQPDRSEIYTALAKAQGDIQNATKNTDNDFTKKPYADLASVLDAVRGPLSKNGIALFQITDDPGEGRLGIRTILAHTSGQTIQDHITMTPPKIDPQGVGSIRTYMRRYSVLAICGISGAADDDAESTKPDPNDYARITASEVDKILMVADKEFTDRADAAVAKMLDRVFGLKRIGDIKAGEANIAIKQLKDSAKLMRESAKKGSANKPSPKPPEEVGTVPTKDDDLGEDVGL
jgi:hypothetical protein